MGTVRIGLPTRHRLIFIPLDGAEAITGSAAYVTGPWRDERIQGAGHWMQLEAPDQVNGLLLDFLASVPSESGAAVG